MSTVTSRVVFQSTILLRAKVVAGLLSTNELTPSMVGASLKYYREHLEVLIEKHKSSSVASADDEICKVRNGNGIPEVAQPRDTSGKK